MPENFLLTLIRPSLNNQILNLHDSGWKNYVTEFTQKLGNNIS